MSTRDDGEDHLPVELGPVSNGEYVPPPQTPMLREAERRARDLIDRQARRRGMSRRDFLFTSMATAAVFFALERATKDAAVWAVFIPALWRAARSFRFPQRNANVGPKELSLRNPGAYEELYLGNEVPFVTSGEPMVMNKRLIAQSGTFIVPGVLDQPIDQILAEYPEAGSTVAKFVLKTSAPVDAIPSAHTASSASDARRSRPTAQGSTEPNGRGAQSTVARTHT